MPVSRTGASQADKGLLHLYSLRNGPEHKVKTGLSAVAPRVLELDWRFYGRALMVLQPESERLEQPRCGPADSAICVINESRTRVAGPRFLLGLACLSQWPFAFNWLFLGFGAG
jgi:hypothetical protein